MFDLQKTYMMVQCVMHFNFNTFVFKVFVWIRECGQGVYFLLERLKADTQKDHLFAAFLLKYACLITQLTVHP